MPKQRNSTQPRTYSMHMAQLQVADFPTGTRRLRHASETARTLSAQGQRPFPFTNIIDSLDHALPIPNNPRSFLIYCAALLLIVAGMMVNVLLSAQILESEVALADLQNREDTLERQNGELLWMIARATNLQQVQDRALAQGYRPITKRKYVGTPPPGVDKDRLPMDAHAGEPAFLGKPAVPPPSANSTSRAPIGQRFEQWRALFLGNSWPESNGISHRPEVGSPASLPSSRSADAQSSPWWLSLKDQVVDEVAAFAGRLAGE